APPSCLPGDGDERLEGVVVDRAAEARVELKARVVRDARQMNHGVHSPEGRTQEVRIPDVAADLREGGVPLREHVVAEEVEVEHRDPIPRGQQFRDEDGADVAGATGHEYGFDLGVHARVPLSGPAVEASRRRHQSRATVVSARAAFRSVTAFDRPWARSW